MPNPDDEIFEKLLAKRRGAFEKAQTAYSDAMKSGDASSDLGDLRTKMRQAELKADTDIVRADARNIAHRQSQQAASRQTDHAKSHSALEGTPLPGLEPGGASAIAAERAKAYRAQKPSARPDHAQAHSSQKGTPLPGLEPGGASAVAAERVQDYRKQQAAKQESPAGSDHSSGHSSGVAPLPGFGKGEASRIAADRATGFGSARPQTRHGQSQDASSSQFERSMGAELEQSRAELAKTDQAMNAKLDALMRRVHESKPSAGSSSASPNSETLPTPAQRGRTTAANPNSSSPSMPKAADTFNSSGGASAPATESAAAQKPTRLSPLSTKPQNPKPRG